MKLKTIDDIERFREAVNKCKDRVWLENANGDIFDLKSSFSQYLAIGKLIEDQQETLELYASLPEDKAILYKLFS